MADQLPITPELRRFYDPCRPENVNVAKWFQQAIDCTKTDYSVQLPESEEKKGKKQKKKKKDRIEYPVEIAKQLQNNRTELEKILEFIRVCDSKDPLEHENNPEFQDDYMRHRELAYEIIEAEYRFLTQFYREVNTAAKTRKQYVGQHKDVLDNENFPPFPEPNFKTLEEQDFDWLATQELIARERAFKSHQERCEKIQALLDGVPNHAVSSRYIFTEMSKFHMQSQDRTSIAARRQDIKGAAIDYYDSDQDMVPDGLWCPVTRRIWRKADLKCAHIIPHTFGQSAHYCMGEPSFSDFLNSTRNLLIVHDEVEKAMDLGQIAFYALPSTENIPPEIKLVVIDRSILDKPVCAGPSRELTWRIVENFEHLEFRNAARPGKRNLYFHFIQSLITAKRKAYEGWYDAYASTSKREFWATPGPWLRRSMMGTLSAYVQMPSIPIDWVNGTFTDSPKSPQLSKEMERYTARELIQSADAVALRAQDSEAAHEQEVEDQALAERRPLSIRYNPGDDEIADLQRSPPPKSPILTTAPLVVGRMRRTSALPSVEETDPPVPETTTGATEHQTSGLLSRMKRRITPSFVRNRMAPRSESPTEQRQIRQISIHGLKEKIRKLGERKGT